MNKRLMSIVLAGLLSQVALRAQPTLLESLRETVVSRWAFQERYPLAVKIFGNQASEADRKGLLDRLHAAADSAPAQGMTEFWSDLAIGLVEEKAKPMSGDPELQSAAQLAQGNIAVNYEMARIFMQHGMYQRAQGLQKEIHKSMLTQGYLRIPELAKVELWNARTAMREGKYQTAHQAVDFAEKLDPLCPWAPLMNMEMHLREKVPWQWDLGALWNSLNDALHLLRYYDVQSLLLVNLSRAIRMGLGLFGCVGLLILFGKYFLRIAHPWAEKLPKPVEMRVRYLAIALVPVSLAVGGAGYLLLGLLAVMLLWKHCSTPERSFLKICLMGLALLPLMLLWERSMCRHLDPRLGINLYHKAYNRGYEKPFADKILAFKGRTHEDSLYRSLAASIEYKKQGDFPKALEQGREAFSRDPQNDMVLLNEGNLDVIGFEYAKASALYAEARKNAPTLAEIWFNSSQAELYSNNSTQHKKFLDRAAEIDPQWITQYLKDNDEHFPVLPPTRKVMDPMLRVGQAWSSAWGSLVDLDFAVMKVRSGILEMPAAWLLGGLLLASVGLYFRFRHYSHHSHGRELFECKICNRIMCRTCRKGVHCQSCFKTVAGVHDNRVKMELVRGLRNRATSVQLRIGGALNAIFPGAGNLYLGLGSGDFSWLFVISMLLGLFWSCNYLLMEYPAFVMHPWRWLALIPLVSLYAVFHIRRLRKPLDYSLGAATQMAREREAVR